VGGGVFILTTDGPGAGPGGEVGRGVEGGCGIGLSSSSDILR
jgi:hypothetical protein